MDRLKEPSTWVGFVTLAALLGGWTWAPEQIGAIATSAGTFAGLMLAWIRERR